MVRDGLQQRPEACFAGLGAAGELLTNLQVPLQDPEGGQEQPDHHQCADQCQPLSAFGGVCYRFAGSSQLAALVLLDGVEQCAQAVHQQVPAGLAQTLHGSLQPGLAAGLHVAGGNFEAVGDGRIEGLEPAPVGKVTTLDLALQAAPVAFQLPETALVGFEIGGVAGEDKTARTGFDVLQGRKDGLDRGDDLQAVTDRAIGLQQRFLRALALPAKRGEQQERSEKGD